MRVDLNRLRILVVEDEFILAMTIVDEIHDHNGVALGPMRTLRQGLDAFYDLEPDACILNIRLGPDMVYELADKLLERRIPFIFASGESRDTIPGRFSHIPLHTKPIDMVKAAAGLLRTSGAKAEG